MSTVVGDLHLLHSFQAGKELGMLGRQLKSSLSVISVCYAFHKAATSNNLILEILVKVAD